MSFSSSPSRFWDGNVILALISPDPLLIIPHVGFRTILSFGPGSFGENIDFYEACKMDTDYDNMTVVELGALVREHGIRGYSGLRKAEFNVHPPLGQPWPRYDPRPRPRPGQRLRSASRLGSRPRLDLRSALGHGLKPALIPRLRLA